MITYAAHVRARRKRASTVLKRAALWSALVAFGFLMGAGTTVASLVANGPAWPALVRAIEIYAAQSVGGLF